MDGLAPLLPTVLPFVSAIVGTSLTFWALRDKQNADDETNYRRDVLADNRDLRKRLAAAEVAKATLTAANQRLQYELDFARRAVEHLGMNETRIVRPASSPPALPPGTLEPWVKEDTS